MIKRFVVLGLITNELLVPIYSLIKNDIMMVKYFFCFLFLQPTLFIYGQQIRTISIDAANARPMNLSEIAEKIAPISLEIRSMIMNGNILLTNEYLFTASPSSIVQFDLTGRFIRTIDCGGYIKNVTCDTINKELYVPVGDIIKCYDYSGKLKKEFSLNNAIAGCFYHKDNLWVQSDNSQTDKSHIYTIGKVNLSTGEVMKLPFEIKKSLYKYLIAHYSILFSLKDLLFIMMKFTFHLIMRIM